MRLDCMDSGVVVRCILYDIDGLIITDFVCCCYEVWRLKIPATVMNRYAEYWTSILVISSSN